MTKDWLETFDDKYQTWNSSYKLNIPMIDKQHIRFFILFDRLLELNKELLSYPQILEVIEELDKYSHIHFQTEEALMQKSNSPNIDLHIIQHQIFISKIEEFKIAYSYKNVLLLDQMIIFMRKWFLMHISEVDGKYVESSKKYLADKELNKN